MATDVERLRDSWADLIEQNDGWLDYRPAPWEGAQMQDVIAQVSLQARALRLSLVWPARGPRPAPVTSIGGGSGGPAGGPAAGRGGVIQHTPFLPPLSACIQPVFLCPAAGQGGAECAVEALPDSPRLDLPPGLPGLQPGKYGLQKGLLASDHYELKYELFMSRYCLWEVAGAALFGFRAVVLLSASHTLAACLLTARCFGIPAAGAQRAQQPSVLCHLLTARQPPTHCVWAAAAAGRWA